MITIKGIKVTSIDVDVDAEGKEKMTGKYSLISNTDKVLAKQGFNSYNDIEVAWSSDTKIALQNLLKGIKQDVKTTLGLTE